jgi:hypothetical protein
MEITYSKDQGSSAATIVVHHLAGRASLEEMLEAQKPCGVRTCALEISTELPDLIHVLRSISALVGVADTLEYLSSAIPAHMARCLVIPIRDKQAITLALVSKWQWEIEIAALLARDDRGVRVKRPGDSARDRLQTRMREFPIAASTSRTKLTI